MAGRQPRTSKTITRRNQSDSDILPEDAEKDEGIKTPNIDKLQRIAFANAYRRGFWRGDGYSNSQAIEHGHSELDEFEAAIISGDKVNQAEEAGDIILLVLSTLHTLGIKGSDAINAAVSKELLKESYID